MTIFCRVCRMQIFSQPILLTSNSARHAKPINEMVFECTQILLTKDIRLPQFLCESCLIRLDEAFAFLKLCRESERMFTETIPMAIKLDNKSDPGNGVSYSHSTNAIELTKCFNNSSSEAIKLELEGDDSKAPLEYAATSSTFSDFSALISGGQTASSAQDNKDWLSEARKHRERQRVSTAKRRANMTPDQRKKERERARIRQAQRRALRSEEQVRAQRERDRVRQAMKRARFRQ
ncbi:hypothetical protein RP20_CCG017158 [Aedes albopictus]|nr:hypothetical protein RP20_CCG017158 [Aedes albopictus]